MHCEKFTSFIVADLEQMSECFELLAIVGRHRASVISFNRRKIEGMLKNIEKLNGHVRKISERFMGYFRDIFYRFVNCDCECSLR